MSWLARRILRPLCCFSSNGANTHRENSRARKRETTQLNTAKLIQPRPNWHGSPHAPINETWETNLFTWETNSFSKFVLRWQRGGGGPGGGRRKFFYSKPARLDKRLINSQGARCIVMHASISIQATVITEAVYQELSVLSEDPICWTVFYIRPSDYDNAWTEWFICGTVPTK